METAIHKTLSDEELMSLLQSRNVKAIELLYDQYGALLFGMIYRICKDNKVAEEILFKTLTYVWNHYNHYDTVQQSLCIWMIGIARKFTLNSLTHQQRISRESIAIQSLKKSGEKDEVMLELMFFRGFSVLKIAELLNCTETRVKKLLRQSIEAFKSQVYSG